jgi:hypothetical protein
MDVGGEDVSCACASCGAIGARFPVLLVSELLDNYFGIISEFTLSLINNLVNEFKIASTAVFIHYY